MFELLQEEFQMGIYDADGIQEYVTLGFIDQTQADQITGKGVPDSASTTAPSSANQPVSSSSTSQEPQSSSSESTTSSSNPQSFYQPNQSSNVTK